MDKCTTQGRLELRWAQLYVFDLRHRELIKSLRVVSVAERLRHQVVALEIEGSNPFAHPIPHFTFVETTRVNQCSP